MKRLLLYLLFFPALANAQLSPAICNVSAIHAVAPTPTIVVTGSFTSFTAVQGSASSSQSLPYNGTNLTGAITYTDTAAILVVSSTGSSFTTSVTTGSPVAGVLTGRVYAEAPSTVSAGTYTGYIKVTSAGVTVHIPYTVVISSPPATSAIFNFSSTASTVSGATNFFGNPTGSPSFTDGATAWTLTAVGANWTNYDGTYFGGVANGSTLASTDGTFTMAQINGNLYNSQIFTTGDYQLEFTNLPAGTYSVYLLGAMQTSVFPNGGTSVFVVKFGAGSENISTFNPNGTGSTGNDTTRGPGTTKVQTGSFNGTITSGQYIYIGVGNGYNTFGGNLGIISAVKIVKTSEMNRFIMIGLLITMCCSGFKRRRKTAIIKTSS